MCVCVGCIGNVVWFAGMQLSTSHASHVRSVVALFELTFYCILQF